MKKNKKNRLNKTVREFLTLSVFVLIILAARASVADHYLVPTGSMRPSIGIGDRVLVNKLAYGIRVPCTNVYLMYFQGPQNGDVVVCESPEDGELLIKRVIAKPGDRVEIQAGRIILNNKPIRIDATPDGLEETIGDIKHKLSHKAGTGPDYGPFVIPKDMYLMVGDNRGNSKDGRSFGLIHRSAVFGRAVGVFLRDGWPEWNSL